MSYDPTEPTELNTRNSALVLIDHQPGVALMTAPPSHADLINSVAGLAEAAKALNVPTVLTTVGATGGPLVDPLFNEISAAFPDLTPIDRTSTAAWANPEVRAAVAATGRRKLVMAGLSTDVCLAQAVLGALKDDYEVFFVPDCSAGVTREAHEDAKTRLTMAGARPINWQAVVSEWAPDYTEPERTAVTPVLIRRGGASALYMDFVLDQVSEGVVKAPEYLREA
ncbi:isochorismatase family protein [Streptomyces sp. NPDC004610]|uniref:isochorismatase family protein n=1 Tax=unclassified Streptomyces TaxID=2593676 RepID=UPI0033B4F1E0